MPKRTTVTLECDLCGTESKPGEGAEPKGWIHWSQDDKYEERKWHERYLCPHCVKEVTDVLKRQVS